MGIEYHAVDISDAELRKAPRGYWTCSADFESRTFSFPYQYDFVFSISVAEHLRDPETFHRNILQVLKNGGTVFHFFSTLYALPFLVNRILPERISYSILRAVEPGRNPEGRRAKFKAYYRWCRGPTRRQIRRFEKIGYSVDSYVGFFGHGYYAKVRQVQFLEDALVRSLSNHPVSLLTSFAYVVLSPAETDDLDCSGA